MITVRLLPFLVLFPLFVQAQSTPLLERLISVDFRNERLANALNQISRSGNFSFSYNPILINETQLITLRATNRPVRDVLGQLFGSSIRLKTRGNHVILLRGEQPNEPPRNVLLEGYILNGQTGERIAEVSVFERQSLRSAISNQYGFYRLKLPTDAPGIRLEVRRRDFFSQSLTVPVRQSRPVNVYLTPVPLRTPIEPLNPRSPIDTLPRPMPVLTEPVVVFAMADSAARPLPSSPAERSRRALAKWALSTKQRIIDINLDRDTLYRTWQVSLVPYIGTNHSLSGRIINGVSLNALVGYSLGVRKFEAGGLLNIVRGDVRGVQLAGFGNLVGEATDGVQLAGFINTNRGDVGPVQMAGFVNVVRGNVHGFQAAGFVNADRQGATGVQIAGFVNAVGKVTQGVQVAGFANVAGSDVLGWQIAGFTNVVRGQLTGWQVSGFLNRARNVVGGRQVGFLNVARSSEKAPIGFLSFVRENGYRNVELSANDVTTLNATVRTGVRQFYNLFTAGLNPVQEIWSFGYGLGTRTAERRGWSLALEGTAHQLNRTGAGVEAQNLLLRLSPTVEKRLGTRVSLAFGPTLNAYYAPEHRFNPLTGKTLPILVASPNGPDSNRDNWSGWLGGQVGLRWGL